MPHHTLVGLLVFAPSLRAISRKCLKDMSYFERSTKSTADTSKMALYGLRVRDCWFGIVVNTCLDLILLLYENRHPSHK